MAESSTVMTHPRVVRAGLALIAIGVAAMPAALLPTAAVAAGPSFAAPIGLPPLPPLYGATCPTATTCIVVGGNTSGWVITTNDGGHTWRGVQVPGIIELNGVSCLDGTHCVAVGAASSTTPAIATTSDGSTWSAVGSLPSAVPLGSVSCVASGGCLALGSAVSGSTATDSALVSLDGGATWATSTVPTFQGQQTLLNEVSCPTAQRCFIAGGGAWVSDDFGGSWQDVSPETGCSTSTTQLCAPAYSDLSGLDFTDATHGAVSGGDQCGGQGVTQCTGAYFSTSDGGASWTKAPSSGTSSLPFVDSVGCRGGSCLANSDTFTQSTILLTTDGATLATVGGAPGTLDAIACAPSGPCVDVGYNGATGILLDSATGTVTTTTGGTTATTHRVGPRTGPSANTIDNSPVVSSFGTSIPTPAAVGSSITALVLSALLVLGLVLLVVFPSQLFNRTYDANHARIQAWWERRLPWTRARRESAETRALHGAMGLGVAVLAGAVLGTLLDPAVGFNARSAALFLGIVLSFSFLITLSALVTGAYRRARKRGTHWEMRALPSGLLVAGVCVLVSRLVNFQPGYLYGIIGGIAFAGTLPRKDEGHLVALTATATMVVAVIAWLLWVPVDETVARGGAGFGTALLANVLSALFVGGLSGVVLGLVPIRFLPDEKLAAWHRGAWAIVFALAMFGLVQIMLRPQSSSAHVASVPLWTTVGLFLGFGTASVAFWGYFRATSIDAADKPA